MYRLPERERDLGAQRRCPSPVRAERSGAILTWDDDRGRGANARVVHKVLPGEYWLEVRHRTPIDPQGGPSGATTAKSQQSLGGARSRTLVHGLGGPAGVHLARLQQQDCADEKADS